MAKQYHSDKYSHDGWTSAVRWILSNIQCSISRWKKIAIGKCCRKPQCQPAEKPRHFQFALVLNLSCFKSTQTVTFFAKAQFNFACAELNSQIQFECFTFFNGKFKMKFKLNVYAIGVDGFLLEYLHKMRANWFVWLKWWTKQRLIRIYASFLSIAHCVCMSLSHKKNPNICCAYGCVCCGFANLLLAGSIYCRFYVANDRQSFDWGAQINNKSVNLMKFAAQQTILGTIELIYAKPWNSDESDLCDDAKNARWQNCWFNAKKHCKCLATKVMMKQQIEIDNLIHICSLEFVWHSHGQ